MSAQWRDRGDPGLHGAFVKWTIPGQVIEGQWLGYHKGKNDWLCGSIETLPGVIQSFSVSKMLQDRIGDLPKGCLIRIEFKGTVPSQKGQPYRIFHVQDQLAEDDPNRNPLPAREPGEDEPPY